MSAPANPTGRVTYAPELKFPGDGQPIAPVHRHDSRRVKDKAGQWTDADTSLWALLSPRR